MAIIIIMRHMNFSPPTTAELIFLKLERARTVLLDKDKRAKYDHWRTGGFRHVVTFEKWMNMQSAVHTVSYHGNEKGGTLPFTQ